MLLGFSPSQFLEAGLLPGSLPLPTGPLHSLWMGGGAACRGAKDLSALCFSLLSSESGSSLEDGYTNHTASLEGLPSIVVLFCRALVSRLIIVVGLEAV